jgi:hypothetical protein
MKIYNSKGGPVFGGLTANIVAVKEILGHSSLEMTMRYAHPEKSMTDAVEKLASFKV